MNKLTKWVLVDGHRLAVSGLMAGLAFLVTFWLTRIGVVTFQPSSTVSTMFGSGVISGVFSLITITLTVNQLVLSRVFGTVNGLTDRLDGTLDFRHTVEDITDRTESPNDPGKFLALIGEALTDRASAFEDERDGAGESTDTDYLSDLRSYADRLTDVEGSDDTMRIVSTLLGPTYAHLLTATDSRVRSDEFSEATTEELDAIRELLKSVAVARQFFKTIAIQQDLAELSRRLVYLGVPVLLVSFYVTTTYTSLPSTMIAQPLLAMVVSVGVAVVLFPLAVLLSHMVRLATIARFTVSVGPFIPPEEQG